MGRIRTQSGGAYLNIYEFYFLGKLKDHKEVAGFQSHDYCNDGLGMDTDHPLFLTHTWVDGCNFEWKGTYQGSGTIGYQSPYAAVDYSQITNWVNQFTAQRIAASASPEKPAVFSLTTLLEWKDVPRMLKHAGDLLHGLKNLDIRGLTSLQMIASSILAWQFGWAPLLQDLGRLLDFGDAVDKRLRTLGELNSGKTVSRRIKFGSISGKNDGNVTVHSTFGITISPHTNVTWETECWATIRWKLRDLHNLRKVPTWWQAFNSLYGLTPGEIPVQVWKALPWSWMIDWFANISEALEVSKNMVTYEPSRLNKMWKTTINVTYGAIHASPTKNFDGGALTRIELNRVQPLVSDVTGIHLKVPFMDAFKLSVLGSLTILKIYRGLK